MSVRIRMIETRPGSENGYEIRYYRQNGIYSVSEDLAAAFVLSRFAVMLDTPPDDGFIDPIEFSGHDDYETQALTLKPRRGRPRKNV